MRAMRHGLPARAIIFGGGSRFRFPNRTCRFTRSDHRSSDFLSAECQEEVSQVRTEPLFVGRVGTAQPTESPGIWWVALADPPCKTIPDLADAPLEDASHRDPQRS